MEACWRPPWWLWLSAAIISHQKPPFFMSCRILTCIIYLLRYLKKLFLLCQIFAIGSQQLSMIFDLKTFHWPEHMVCDFFEIFRLLDFIEDKRK
jgi:hypothetical protein